MSIRIALGKSKPKDTNQGVDLKSFCMSINFESGRDKTRIVDTVAICEAAVSPNDISGANQDKSDGEVSDAGTSVFLMSPYDFLRNFAQGGEAAFAGIVELKRSDKKISFSFDQGEIANLSILDGAEGATNFVPTLVMDGLRFGTTALISLNKIDKNKEQITK